MLFFQFTVCSHYNKPWHLDCINILTQLCRNSLCCVLHITTGVVWSKYFAKEHRNKTHELYRQTGHTVVQTSFQNIQRILMEFHKHVLYVLSQPIRTGRIVTSVSVVRHHNWPRPVITTSCRYKRTVNPPSAFHP